MPVDYFVLILPVLVVVALAVAVAPGRPRSVGLTIAGGLAALFLLIYLVPGWVLWAFAQCGHRDAQFHLGRHYDSRLGYLWTDRESRDRWWLAAAEQGHPEAMYHVGHNAILGTSSHTPKDYAEARRWLESARAAGASQAASDLRYLSEREAEERP